MEGNPELNNPTAVTSVNSLSSSITRPILLPKITLRDYLLFLTDTQRLEPSTVNVALQALKLFFKITCPRDWQVLKLARVQSQQKSHRPLHR